MGTTRPALLLGILLLTTGCASPPAVSTATSPDTPADALLPVESPGVLGGYTLQLRGTTDAPEAALIPLAGGAAVGDSYMLDASRYFTGGLCGDCVKVSGIGLVDPTTLDLTITVRHPFPKPPATLGPNDRLDLHIFDVTGLLVSAEPGGPSFPSSGLSIAPIRLLNAAGYSGVLDPFLDRIFPTPGADLHPYRAFALNSTSGNFDGGSATGFTDVAAPSGHNVLPMGGQASSTYRIAMPPAGSSVTFEQDLLFVVSASWGQGAGSKPERQTPAYRLPEFNQKAAFEVSASVTANTLAEDDPTGEATLQLEVSDWQWPTSVAGTWPDPASKGTVRTASIPEQIVIDIPGLLSIPLQFDPGTLTGSGIIRGGEIAITNTADAAEGSYLGLVQVIDSLSGAQGIAQDDPIPTGLGQLRTAQVFRIDVGPSTVVGDFGDAVLISDRNLAEITGHFNTNMPELVTDGVDLYLGYQGPSDEAVVARSITGGASWSNVEIYQGAPDSFMDPSIGCLPNSDELQVVLAAPDETGTYASRSTDNGSNWAILQPVHDDGGSPDDSQAISSGAGDPCVIYGTLREVGGDLEFILGSAIFNGSLWSERGNITDVNPGGGIGLIRVDESPMVYRLSASTLVCIFSSNQRPIADLDDDTISEPVAVRSLDNGLTWQDWAYVRPLDATRTIETLASAQQGTALYCIEVSELGVATLKRSTDEGQTWVTRPLPAELGTVKEGICEIITGPDQRQALVWVPSTAGNGELQCALSEDGGASWMPAVGCEDDAGNNFEVITATGAYTDDGRLHVAFTTDRGPGGAIGWWGVSQSI